VFVARLRDLTVPAIKLSQAGSNVCGSTLHIDWVNWISPQDVTVVGGDTFSLCAGFCPPIGVYRLVRRNKSWHVLGYEIWNGTEWYRLF